MDFHVWARLDSFGRVLSFQSKCCQRSDSSPLQSPPLDCPDMVTGEKVVPYCTKKDLEKRLDRKVDEMSLMVMQTAELTKRSELQEKLIKQYEETIRHLHEEIAKLKKELSVYRSFPADADASVTERKIVRNSQTSIKVVCSVETETKVSDEPRSVTSETKYDGQTADDNAGDECGCPTDACSSDKSDVITDDIDATNTCCCSVGAGRVRPSTLNLDLTVEDFPENEFNDSLNNSNNLLCENAPDIVEINGYSYANKNKEVVTTSGDLPTPNDGRPCKLAPVFDCTDGNGYLCFGNLNTDSDGELEVDVPDMNQPYYINMGDPAHMSLKELAGNYPEKDVNERSSPSRDSPVNFHLPSPTGHKVMTSGYAEIDEDMLDGALQPDVSNRPPLPKPRRQKSIEEQVGIPLLAATTLPRKTSAVDTMEGSKKVNERKKARASLGGNLSGTLPCNNCISTGRNTSPLFIHDKHRSQSSPDIRNLDHINVVLKDMRTTMEWNKEKRDLMAVSTSCTTQEAQDKLDCAVHEIHKAFMAATRKRSKKNREPTVHDLTVKVREATKRRIDVSGAFCEKCVALLLSSMKVRTP